MRVVVKPGKWVTVCRIGSNSQCSQRFRSLANFNKNSTVKVSTLQPDSLALASPHGVSLGSIELQPGEQ